ncbi:Os01g0369366, partial [Oryza sativa Japonica Group]
DVVDHADFDKADVRDVEHEAGASAILAEESVGDVDGELLEHRRALPRLDVRVAHDVGDAGVLGLHQRAQLLLHPGVRVLVRHLEPHAPPAREPRRLRLVAGPRDHGHAALHLHGGDDPIVADAAALVEVGLHLHELGDPQHEVVLEVGVLGEHVLVAVPNDAAVHAELPRADAADEVALLVADVRHRHGLDADEDEHLVERRQVGDEVREDGRHAGGQLGVDDADPRDAHDAQAGAERVDPPERHLVLHVELVLPPRAVVPHVHDGDEHQRQHQRQPPALGHLHQRRRQVHRLDDAERHQEERRHQAAVLPDEDDDERHEQRGDQHHPRARHPVGVADEGGVAEPHGDGDAQQHQDPVDLRAVDLPVDPPRRVHDLHAREAAQRRALPHDGEGRRYHRLAAHDRRQRRDHQHRPE